MPTDGLGCVCVCLMGFAVTVKEELRNNTDMDSRCTGTKRDGIKIPIR